MAHTSRTSDSLLSVWIPLTTLKRVNVAIAAVTVKYGRGPTKREFIDAALNLLCTYVEQKGRVPSTFRFMGRGRASKVTDSRPRDRRGMYLPTRSGKLALPPHNGETDGSIDLDDED